MAEQWRIHKFRTSISRDGDVLALNCVGKSMTGRDWTCYVETEGGTAVLETSGESAEEAITTARLVLQRIAAHEALVKACQSALTSRTVLLGSCEHAPDYVTDCVECGLRSALALAQKESE